MGSDSFKKNRLEKWKKVWERKGRQAKKANFTLKDLIAMDGFDTATGKVTEDTWMKFVGLIKRELNLKKGDFLLEVGCGAGAILLPLSEMGIRVAGIDYSSSLIKVAKKVIPNITARVGEANKLPFENNKFNAVASFSVFFYFPDYEYAENTLLEMLRISKNNARILIGDVPDLAKKEMSEKYRQKSLPKEEYRRLYSDHSHLYYSKKWFEDFARRNGLFIKIFDQNIKNYGNARFRFNVLITKRKI